MTMIDRVEAVLRKESVDRIPFIPRIDIWYNALKKNGTLPPDYAGCSLEDIEKKLEIGCGLRGGRLFRESFPGIEISESVENGKLTRTYRTPKGELYTKFMALPAADGKFRAGEQLEYMIKSENDYDAAISLFEHAQYSPNYSSCPEYEARIGNNGIPIYHNGYDPMFAIIHTYVGYDRIFYDLADCPELVDALYNTMARQYQGIQEMLLNSPCRFIIHGTHFDQSMTPLRLFEKYMIPYYSSFAEKMKQKGKKLVFHADADSRLLLGAFERCGISMVECFCTAPMVSVTMEDALQAWDGRIGIWGGLPSTIFCPELCPEEMFYAYCEKLFGTLSKSNGGVILGIADNLMPQGDIRRVEWVAERVADGAGLPRS